MTPRRNIRIVRGLAALLVTGTLPLLLGCFNPFNPLKAPVSGVSEPPPAPSSPVGVLRLFEWCWNHRDADLYRELFTDDYQFLFALTDSAGNAYRDRALTREEDLDIATNLFIRGTATEPPPASIRLTFDPNLIAVPDSRAGKDAHWHKEIAAQTLLVITDPDIQVQGTTRFFVVRGDSAVLPLELIQRGFKQDSTRWYIQQIQDETISGPNAPARAARTPGTAAAALVRGTPRADGGYDPQVETWGELLARFDNRARQAATARATRTTHPGW